MNKKPESIKHHIMQTKLYLAKVSSFSWFPRGRQLPAVSHGENLPRSVDKVGVIMSTAENSFVLFLLQYVFGKRLKLIAVGRELHCVHQIRLYFNIKLSHTCENIKTNQLTLSSIFLVIVFSKLFYFSHSKILLASD